MGADPFFVGEESIQAVQGGRDMRIARIKADGAGYYHCMSRIIERRHILNEPETEQAGWRDSQQIECPLRSFHGLCFEVCGSPPEL